MVSPQRSSETEAGTCRWLYMMSNHKRICPLLKTEPDVLRTSRGGSLEVSVLPMEKYGAFNGNMLGKSWENAGNILDRCGKPCGETCSENDLQMVRAASFSVCFCFGLDDFGTSVNTIDQVQFSFPQPAIRRKKTFSIPKFTRGFLKTWVHFLPH